jgi:hypothetical protein
VELLEDRRVPSHAAFGTDGVSHGHAHEESPAAIVQTTHAHSDNASHHGAHESVANEVGPAAPVDNPTPKQHGADHGQGDSDGNSDGNGKGNGNAYGHWKKLDDIEQVASSKASEPDQGEDNQETSAKLNDPDPTPEPVAKHTGNSHHATDPGKHDKNDGAVSEVSGDPSGPGSGSETHGNSSKRASTGQSDASSDSQDTGGNVGDQGGDGQDGATSAGSDGSGGGDVVVEVHISGTAAPGKHQVSVAKAMAATPERAQAEPQQAAPATPEDPLVVQDAAFVDFQPPAQHAKPDSPSQGFPEAWVITLDQRASAKPAQSTGTDGAMATAREAGRGGAGLNGVLPVGANALAQRGLGATGMGADDDLSMDSPAELLPGVLPVNLQAMAGHVRKFFGQIEDLATQLVDPHSIVGFFPWLTLGVALGLAAEITRRQRKHRSARPVLVTSGDKDSTQTWLPGSAGLPPTDEA